MQKTGQNLNQLNFVVGFFNLWVTKIDKKRIKFAKGKVRQLLKTQFCEMKFTIIW